MVYTSMLARLGAVDAGEEPLNAREDNWRLLYGTLENFEEGLEAVSREPTGWSLLYKCQGLVTAGSTLRRGGKRASQRGCCHP